MAKNRIPILLTRPKIDSESMARDLKKQGFQTLIEPLLHIEHCDLEPADCDANTTCILTSKHAIAAFKILDIPTNTPCYAVGKSTGKLLKKAGYKNIQQISDTAEALADYIIEHHPKTQPLLYLRGETVRLNLTEMLGRQGFLSNDIITYRTLPTEGLSLASCAALAQESPVIVTLFSIATAEQFARQLSAANIAPPHLIVVAMSEAIANASKTLSAKQWITAKQPNYASMLEAVANAVQMGVESGSTLHSPSLPPSVAMTEKTPQTDVTDSAETLPANAETVTDTSDTGTEQPAQTPKKSGGFHLGTVGYFIIGGAILLFAATKLMPDGNPFAQSSAPVQTAMPSPLTQQNTTQPSAIVPVIETQGPATPAIKTASSPASHTAGRTIDADTLTSMTRYIDEQTQLTTTMLGQISEERDKAVKETALLKCLVMLEQRLDPQSYALCSAATTDTPLASVIADLTPPTGYVDLSRDTLLAAFDSAIKAALSPAPVETDNLSFWEELQHRLASLVVIRQVGKIEGSTAEAMIARGEAQLKSGNVAAAIEEIQQLTGESRDAFAHWLNLAELHRQQHALIHALKSALLPATPAAHQPK